MYIERESEREREREREREVRFNHIKLMFSSYVLSVVISSISVTYTIQYS